MFISVVIPAKNEEENIARCLDSIIASKPASYEIEIILVDCLSTDRTIDIAKNYPIKILQLKPDWFHSAPAARYIGSLFVRGEFIFFIDSDMALENGFLEKAVEVLKTEKDVAAVGGIADELYIKDTKECGVKPNLYQTKNYKSNVNFLAGAILYRKAVLDEVKGFNPYLNAGGEELELAQRIRNRNYRLISIPVPMATHYTAKIDEWEEFLRKKRAKLFMGIGNSLRLSHSVRYFFETMLYYREFALFLIFISYTLGLLGYSISSHNLKPILFMLLPILLLFIGLALRKKNFKAALISLIKWFVMSTEILRGFFKMTEDPKNYPKDPIIIKGDFNV